MDFSHAAGYVSQIGQAVFGEGTPEFKAWLATTLHALKHDAPATVLQTLRAAVNYLDKRQPQMEYAHFQAAGYPIGSGSVESGNKVVVEARLKGAGMHWAREHVNPMVALRNILGSARWDEDWTRIASRLRDDPLKQRQQRQRVRRPQRLSVSAPNANLTTTLAESPQPAAAKRKTRKRNRSLPHPAKQPYRPPANHLWRHLPIGRARFKPYRSGLDPKS